MPQPSWTDRLTGSAPSRIPRGGLTAAVTAIRAGRPGSARPGAARAGTIRRQSAGTGSPARSGRSSTVAAAARAFSA